MAATAPPTMARDAVAEEAWLHREADRASMRDAVERGAIVRSKEKKRDASRVERAPWLCNGCPIEPLSRVVPFKKPEVFFLLAMIFPLELKLSPSSRTSQSCGRLRQPKCKLRPRHWLDAGGSNQATTAFRCCPSVVSHQRYFYSHKSVSPIGRGHFHTLLSLNAFRISRRSVVCSNILL